MLCNIYSFQTCRLFWLASWSWLLLPGTILLMILRLTSLTCLIRAGKEELDLEEVISADPGLTRDGDTAVSAALFIKQRMIQTKSRISMASVHLHPPASKRTKVVGGFDSTILCASNLWVWKCIVPYLYFIFLFVKNKMFYLYFLFYEHY